MVAEAGFVDALQETSRDDLVRVDVFCGEAGDPGLDAIEFGHNLFIRVNVGQHRPSSAEEGWPRHQEKYREASL